MSDSATHAIEERLVRITTGPVRLDGDLNLPEGSRAVVLFAHGSGVGPDDGSTEFIGLSDHGIVWHDDPLAVKAHPIFAVLRIPINILNAEPIRERAAQAISTSEMVEPCMQRLIGIAAIVACLHGHKSAEKKD